LGGYKDFLCKAKCLDIVALNGLADCPVGFFIGVGQPGDEIERIGAGDMVEIGETGLCDHGRVGMESTVQEKMAV